MEKQLIEFETAKLAKEKGFGKTLDMIYPWAYKIVSLTKYTLMMNSQNNTLDMYISAPTQSLLQKWLREVHGIHLEIVYHRDHSNYYWNMHGSFGWDGEKLSFKTYEEALEVGLEEGLKLIK